MGCNGGRELTFLKWCVVRAAPLNPDVRATNQRLPSMLLLVRWNLAHLNSSDMGFLGFAFDVTVRLVRGRLGKQGKPTPVDYNADDQRLNAGC